MAQTDLLELVATLGINTDPYTAGINAALGLFNGLSDAMKAGITLAIDVGADFAKDVFETGMGFDREMSAVQAVLGQEEGTVENMIKLRENALDVAEDSIFTAEETAKAYYYMGMAGWKTEQMLAGLPGIISLAAASGEDLGRVSDIVTDSITAFGLTADDVGKYVDILAQTATNSNTDVKRMGETFKYVAPIAGTLGYDVEDVALSIGLLASAGIKGSMAGTTLRNVFTRIATNAEATSKDLGALEIITDKLGVSFYTAEGKARDWGDVLSELREAWRGMSGEDRKNVVDAFNESIGSTKEADVTLKEFAADALKVSELYAEMNKLSKNDTEGKERYAEQIKEIGSQYDELLKLLGIEIGTDGIYNYAEALEKARIKMGNLTDQEKIYYAKQIGSMRGMAGVIRMLEATDDDVQKLAKSYETAQGAAEAMAGVRLDNLWGDLQLFNAAYDVMKVSIFDEVKGPVRELVQEATQWILDITDAIGMNGLQGGIDMLAAHLDALADDEHIQTLLNSIGGFIGVIVGGIIDKALPKLVDAAPSLISALFGGFGSTVTNNVNDYSGSTTRDLAGVAKTISGLFNTNNGITGIFQNAFQIKPVADIDDIQDALNEANEKGELYVTINDVQFSSSLDAVTIMDQLIAATDSSLTEGFAVGAVNAEGIMSTTSTAIANGLAADIGAAGTPAGEAFATNLQTEIGNRDYSINVNAHVEGLPDNVQHNARAMASGRIFDHPTIFGYAEGAYQVAGDAGPEAVVGVNSLQSMITGAVGAALSALQPASSGDIRPINIIFEVDGVQKYIYRAYKAEEQRVGLKLSTGGAY